jgi:hypothetical protein
MAPLREWYVEDSRGNTITFTAPSKTQAKKQYKRMFAGGSRIIKIEDRGEIKTGFAIPNIVEPKEEFTPVEPIRREFRPGVNDKCPCGATKADGAPKKYKRCCGRKR